MKASLINKLDLLQDRFEELTALLGDAEVISNQPQFRAYSKEYAEIEPVYQAFSAFRKVQSDLEGAQALLKDSDPDMREMAEEEVAEAKEQLIELEATLQRMLLPKDPNDGRNVFLEVRAGTGGDEAAIFSGDLFRMYSRYAEKQGWRVEVLSASEGEHGGYKEVIARVEGDNVYGKLKFESGAHRVQRVPETESQGRIHTSACTVAVLPEPDEQAKIDINPACCGQSPAQYGKNESQTEQSDGHETQPAPAGRQQHPRPAAAGSTGGWVHPAGRSADLPRLGVDLNLPRLDNMKAGREAGLVLFSSRMQWPALSLRSPISDPPQSWPSRGQASPRRKSSAISLCTLSSGSPGCRKRAARPAATVVFISGDDTKCRCSTHSDSRVRTMNAVASTRSKSHP